MGGFLKRIAIVVTILAGIFLLGGCSGRQGRNIASYLNNTLEYFISDTGVEVELNEAGFYANEEQGIQILVKDNLVQKIWLTKTGKEYEISKVRVGDKKKRVEKLIGEEYTSEPTITEDSEAGTTVYAYQKENRLFTVTYDSESLVTELAMEVTAYTVGSITSDGIGESEIDKNEIMVTVGNIDVSYSEAMVYLRTAQQIYESEFGNDVWSYDLYGNGTTVGAVLKQEVLNQIIQLEIINMVANEKGITLNDDEMYQVRSLAAEYILDLSEQDIAKYGITEDLAVQVFATNLIAEKLYETVTIDVDTEVSDADARQSKIYKLFVQTYGTDSKGNRTELRDSELEEIRTKVEGLHTQAVEGSDFYSLAESNSDGDEIELTVGRGDLSSEEEEIVFALKDGQVSEILQTEDGYEIFYCVDAYDEDATLQVKEEIIEQRRSDLFVELYTQWYSNYEVKVNMNLWNQLELAPLNESSSSSNQ